MYSVSDIVTYIGTSETRGGSSIIMHDGQIKKRVIINFVNDKSLLTQRGLDTIRYIL